MNQAEPKAADRTGLRVYVIGFGLSVLLTLLAFYLVSERILGGWAIVAALLGFAVVQLVVQLQFFVHLGAEGKPRWNLTAFAFMALVLLIVVLGSLWIMNNLSYHQMSPSEVERYLLEEEVLD